MTEEEKKKTADRIKEAIGNDTQAVAAKKINSNQGAVSRLIKGADYPTSATVIEICKAYNVSADWLLGLSDDKHPNTFDSEHITYEQAVLVLSQLLQRKAIQALKTNAGYLPISCRMFDIEDPLLKHLVDCQDHALLMRGDAFKNWERDSVSKFNLELLMRYDWREPDFPVPNEQNRSDEDWLDVYDWSVQEREMDYEIHSDIHPYWKEKKPE